MSVDQLSNLNVTQKQSTRWREIAAVPEKTFEAYIADGLAKKGERHKGHGDQKSDSRSASPILSDLDVNRTQSSRWQQIAAVPEKTFDFAAAYSFTVELNKAAIALREPFVEPVTVFSPVPR
jgi:hypothetical protein